ncbi:dna-binding protein rhl1 [Nannochloropsis gaditana]|uniref:Dna-binding protein rhl1 n=1 Tax=Nannochloropsis gaditana TaxID=72520 RepID=W7TM28_9STRA|nr:dna-binding protein rhl1 [Nannochloropsis gaditana]
MPSINNSKASKADDDPALVELRDAEARVEHVLTKKPVNLDAAKLVPSSIRVKDLRRWDGCDIVRKGAKKTRYVFLLPAIMTITQAGGKLGTIALMDTETPVLYLDFPQGRMKCQGRIVRPEVRLLPLAFEGKRSVTCKDLVNTLVVFSKVWWIGTEKENPEEKPWPFPKEMNFQVEGPQAGEALGGTRKEGGGREREGKEAVGEVEGPGGGGDRRGRQSRL